MIKFFRRIRMQLISQNRMSKYLLYAIGEILLVVIGIMIALQANQWKENTALNSERQELISDLIIDFENTQQDLDSLQSSFKSSQSNMRLFFKDVYTEQKNLPLDSLQNLVIHFFYTYEFNPTLTTYNYASSSGKLSLIKNKKLKYLFSEFFQSYNTYLLHNDIDARNFYQGSVWDLRKEIGSMRLLLFIDNYEELMNRKISYEEYTDVLKSKLTFATFESRFTLVQNILAAIQTMSETNTVILEELKKDIE